MILYILMCLVVGTQSSEWLQWKAQNGKIYSSSMEDNTRQSIFETNQRIINIHNADVYKVII